MEKTIKGYTYRVKKLNALDIFAIKTACSFKTVESAKTSFEQILNKIEVQCLDKWITCFEEDNFYPANLENDVELVNELVSWFVGEVINPHFKKLDE